MYSDWGDMAVNQVKTLISGALHKTAPLHGNNPYPNSYLRTTLSKITIQSKPITYISPQSPITCLGVDLTMSLDWSHQYRKAATIMRETTTAVTQSWATPRQKLALIETCIKPKVSYGFCVAPHTPAELDCLDVCMRTCVRNACGLPRYTPAAMLHSNKDDFGIGCNSLHTAYASTNVATLVSALNDKGRLGLITQHLLIAQLKLVNRVPASLRPEEARYSMRVRQLSLLNENELAISFHNSVSSDLNTLHPTVIVETLKVVKDGANDVALRQALQNAMRPLLGLGITHWGCLTTNDRTAMITCNDLKLKHGFTKIKNKHRVALHRLTLIMNSATPATDILSIMQKSQAACLSELPLASRLIHPNNKLIITLPPSVASVAQARRYHGPAANAAATHATADPTLPSTHARRQPATQGTHDTARTDPPTDIANDPMDVDAPQDTRTGDPPNNNETQQPARRTRVAQRSPRNEPTLHRDKRKRVHGNHRAAGKRPKRRHILPKTYATHLTPRVTAGCTAGDLADFRRRHMESIASRCRRRCGDNARLQVLNTMYQDVTQPQAISGWQQLTEDKHKHSELLVHWSPTLMPKWAIDIYKRFGYSAARVEEAPLDADEHDSATCELCWRGLHATGHDMRKCNGCCLYYHGACIPAHLHDHSPDGSWRCPVCASEDLPIACKRHHCATNKLHWVQWEPTWEPEKQLIQDGYGDMVEAYKEERDAKRDTTVAVASPAADTHLPNIVRQGGSLSAPEWVSTYGHDIRTKLAIDRMARNPYIDIVGNGKYAIHKVPVPTYVKGMTVTGDRACIYNPEGTCVGTLCWERLTILHARYHRAMQTGKHNQLNPVVGPFEEEVASLLHRYKDGSLEPSTGKKVKLKNHWAIPPGVFEAFRKHLRIEKERFASPLNFDPFHAHYWSMYERDSVFDACWDAFSVRWTGFSEANPEYEDECMHKAVKWAVDSALHADTPTATLLCLPDWTQTSNTSYTRLIHAHPETCTVLATVDKGAFRFTTPDHWTGGEEFAKHPRWSVTFLLVWNQQAQHTLALHDMSNGAYTNLQRDLLQALNDTNGGAVVLPEAITWGPIAPSASTAHPPSTGDPSYRVKRAFSTKPTDDSMLDTSAERPATDLPYPELPFTLRSDWRDFTYTDGSCLKLPDGTQSIGGGVYCPMDADDPTKLYGRHEVNPFGCGTINTINRAELAAIWYALHLGKKWIATDSSAAMCQISTAVLHPQKLKFHKHADLLRLIVDIIAESDTMILLCKVKAHSGMPGNEIADELAKQAATHRRGYKIPEGTHFQDLYWPTYEHTFPDGSTQRRYVDNLTDSVKKHMSARLSTGRSDTNGVYFRSWQKISPHAHCGHSNRLWTDTHLTHAHRMTAFKFRTGTLFNNKLAHRFGLSPHPNCPLCGTLDGGMHMVSGCPHPFINKLVIERHNSAGRLILKAVLKGRHGNSVLSADVGKLPPGTRVGLPLTGRTLPADLMDTLALATRRTPTDDNVVEASHRRSIPDAVVVAKWDDTNRSRTFIKLVEIKYARDTDPDERKQTAIRQHQPLVEKIRGLGFQCEVVPILLGVSGTIFKQSMTALTEDLGISPAAADKLAAKLHRHAVLHMHTIVGTRRHIEHRSHPAPADHRGQPRQHRPPDPGASGVT